MLLERCWSLCSVVQWLNGHVLACSASHIALREALQATYAKQYGPLGTLLRIPLA